MIRRSLYLAEFECPADCPPLPPDDPDPLGGQSKMILKEIVKRVTDKGYPVQVSKRAKPPQQVATMAIDGHEIVIFIDQIESGVHFNKYHLDVWPPTEWKDKANPEPDSDFERLAKAYTIILDEQLRETVASFGGKMLPFARGELQGPI